MHHNSCVSNKMYSMQNSPFNASVSFRTAMQTFKLTKYCIFPIYFLFCEHHVSGIRIEFVLVAMIDSNNWSYQYNCQNKYCTLHHFMIHFEMSYLNFNYLLLLYLFLCQQYFTIILISVSILYLFLFCLNRYVTFNYHSRS